LGTPRTFTLFPITAPTFSEINTSFATQVNALPASSMVIFAVNGGTSYQDQLTTQLNTLTLTNIAPSGTTTLFGTNYSPTTIALVQWQLQEYPSFAGPFYADPYLISIGFSNSPTSTLTNDSRWIQSMGYLNSMACGKPWRGTDGTMKFDVNKSYVAPYITQYFYPANTLNPTVISSGTNPSWASLINTTVAFPI